MQFNGLYDSFDNVLVHQINFVIFSIAIQMQDFSMSLQERLKSFQFQNDTLISQNDFDKFIDFLRDLPIWIPQSHTEVLKLVFLKKKGSYNVSKLKLPPKKQKKLKQLPKLEMRAQSSISNYSRSSSPKLRHSLTMQNANQQSFEPLNNNVVVSPKLQINVIQAEEQDFEQSNQNYLYVDVESFLQIMSSEQIFMKSHSAQVNTLAVYMSIIDAIDGSHQYVKSQIENYLQQMNALSALKNDFSHFRKSMKHFIPHCDLGISSKIFSDWMKQEDRESMSSLSRVMIDIITHEDFKSGQCLLLSEQMHNRPLTPRNFTKMQINDGIAKQRRLTANLGSIQKFNSNIQLVQRKSTTAKSSSPDIK